MAGDDDPYANVAKGALKLKGDSGVKKKKKKDKKLVQQVNQAVQKEESKQNETSSSLKRTKAEQAFQKMQEKMVNIKVAAHCFDHTKMKTAH